MPGSALTLSLASTLSSAKGVQDGMGRYSRVTKSLKRAYESTTLDNEDMPAKTLVTEDVDFSTGTQSNLCAEEVSSFIRRESTKYLLGLRC